MDNLEPENQILLFEAIRRYFPETENKELVIPMIVQWFNERSSQFVPATELDSIIRSLYDVSKGSPASKVARPFSFRFT